MVGLGFHSRFLIFLGWIGAVFAINAFVKLLDEVHDGFEIFDWFPGVVMLGPSLPLYEVSGLASDVFPITDSLYFVAFATVLNELRLRITAHLMETNVK